MGLAFYIKKEHFDLVRLRSIQLALIGLDDHTDRCAACPDISVAINCTFAFGPWHHKVVKFENVVRPVALGELQESVEIALLAAL